MSFSLRIPNKELRFKVILSTGYSFEFPLAEAGTLIPVVDNDVSLYLNMYPVETADHNSLAVIGLIQVEYLIIENIY